MARRRPIPNSLEAVLRSDALGYPDAVEDFPWDERVVKVRGKIFLFLSAAGSTVLRFSVKLPASGAEALELGYVEPTRYGLGKHGWVTATVDLTRESPVETFRAWIGESYRAVAPKALVARLDAAPDTVPKRDARSTRTTRTKRRAQPNSAPRAKGAPRAKRRAR